MKCIYCAGEVADDAFACKHCGRAIMQPPPSQPLSPHLGLSPTARRIDAPTSQPTEVSSPPVPSTPETKSCPFCAETIKYNAIVCRYCGRDLQAHGPMPPTRGASPSKHKKPWIAVALNLFPLVMGLGYIYVRRPVRFIVVFAIQLLSLLPMTMLGLREYNQYFLGALWIFTLFDGYSQAKLFNSSLAALP